MTWPQLPPQLEAQLDELLDAPPDERAALLHELTGGDAARKAQLEGLLADCERTSPLLDEPAAERFSALLHDDRAVFPGGLADRYRLTRELGRGGMATVFLARDLRHERDVAVKVMRPELALGRGRFLREIAIAAKLRHPNIVPLFDSGDADGVLYYIMPFEEGQSLRARLKREGALPLDDVVTILRDVCEALVCAHQNGIVHRDIKPDNVLLAGRHAMVTDFGVARAISASTERSSQITGGIAIGTPAYMAPEQVAADPDIDHRADIYALGVLAYELLTGRPPFTGDAQRVLSAHVTEIPAPLAPLRPDIPPALAAMVMKCLAKSAADRWQHADQVRDALDRALDTDAAIEAPAAAPLAPPRPGAPAGRWRGATAGISLAIVAVLVALGLWQDSRSRQADVMSRPLLGIGILPVSASSPKGELDWLPKGVATQLSTELTGVEGLDVRPNETIAAAVAGRSPLDSVALLHNLNYLVRAGLSKGGGDTVIVTLELIEGGVRSVLAGTVREPLRAANAGNAIQVLARSMAEQLRPMLGSRVRELQLESGTRNRIALQHRNRANQFRLFARRYIGQRDVAGATAALDSATAHLLESQRLDDSWAAPRLARASLSGPRALLLLANPGATDYTGIRQAFDAGIAIVDSVLKKEPRAAPALALRGRLRWQRILLGEARPHEASAAADSSQRDVENALAIDSTLARAAADLSQLLFEQHARFADAAVYAERAYRLDAFMEDASQIITRLAQSNLETGQDADALHWCGEGVRRFPGNPAHHGCFLEVMAWGGGLASADSAWKYFRELERNRGTLNVSAKASHEVMVAAILARASGVPADSARSVLARTRAHVASSPMASEALRDEMLAFEAAVLFRLGDTARANQLFAEYGKRDSVKAENLARRRMLRAYVVRAGTPGK